MAEPQKQDQHHAALDGIRGVAILLVMFFHTGLIIDGSTSLEATWLKCVSLGWAGVDLFFVLSGFLITTILLETRRQKNYFRNFYMRRALRIFPLYFVVLLAITRLVKHSGHDVWYWLFVANWIPVFDGTPQIMMLQPFWSLAVEEQFYLIWPFAIWCFSEKQIVKLASVLVVLTLVGRIIGKMQGVDAWSLYVVTVFRLDALAAGALLACIWRHDKEMDRRSLRVAPIACLIVGALGIGVIAATEGGYRIDGFWAQTAGYSSFALLSVGLIWTCLRYPSARGIQFVFANRCLRYIGNRSYALYLVHLPVFVLCHAHLKKQTQAGSTEVFSDVTYALTGVGISFFLAALSWQVLEQPFLNLKSKFPRHSDSTNGS